MSRRICIGDHTGKIVNYNNNLVTVYDFQSYSINTLSIFIEYIRYICSLWKRRNDENSLSFIRYLKQKFNFYYQDNTNDYYYSHSQDYLEQEEKAILLMIKELNIEFRGQFDCKFKTPIMPLPIRLPIDNKTIISEYKEYPIVCLAIEFKVQLVNVDDGYYYYY